LIADLGGALRNKLAGGTLMRALQKVILVCGMLALADSTAMAQTQPPKCTFPSHLFGLRDVVSLTGCPFSAVVEIERSQTLADGTQIHTKSKAHVYRDSFGRMRYESYAPAGVDKDIADSPNMIEILDPVAGFGYLLDPRSAVAGRHKLPGPETNPEVGGQSQPPLAPASASPPAQEPRQKPLKEKLGTREMEGLIVEGWRTTWMVPAQAEGNDRPLTHERETWNSNLMGITLLVKTSDPRTGEVERRMTNLERLEPDAALFQVPAQYTTRDQ